MVLPGGRLPSGCVACGKREDAAAALHRRGPGCRHAGGPALLPALLPRSLLLPGAAADPHVHGGDLRSFRILQAFPEGALLLSGSFGLRRFHPAGALFHILCCGLECPGSRGGGLEDSQLHRRLLAAGLGRPLPQRRARLSGRLLSERRRGRPARPGGGLRHFPLQGRLRRRQDLLQPAVPQLPGLVPDRRQPLRPLLPGGGREAPLPPAAGGGQLPAFPHLPGNAVPGRLPDLSFGAHRPPRRPPRRGAPALSGLLPPAGALRRLGLGEGDGLHRRWGRPQGVALGAGRCGLSRRPAVPLAPPGAAASCPCTGRPAPPAEALGAAGGRGAGGPDRRRRRLLRPAPCLHTSGGCCPDPAAVLDGAGAEHFPSGEERPGAPALEQGCP